MFARSQYGDEMDGVRPSMVKFVPLWSGLFFILAMAGLYVLYILNVKPEVLQSQALMAEKNALTWQASTPALEKLPSVLVSGAYLALAIAGGIAVSLLIGAVALFFGVKTVQTGIGIMKEGPNGITRIYIANPSTLVAAHLQSRGVGAGAPTVSGLGPGFGNRPAISGPAMASLGASRGSGPNGDGQPSVRPGDHPGGVPSITGKNGSGRRGGAKPIGTRPPSPADDGEDD